MGNRLICMTKKDIHENGGVLTSRSSRFNGGGGGGSSRSQRKSLTEEELLHRQALSFVVQQHQQLLSSQRFDSGSMSRRIGSVGGSRRRDLSESFSNEKPLSELLDSIKEKKIVLVHGEGFGAWCWYKTIALLEESGLLPTALDLTGSGIDMTDTNNIATLADYAKPLIKYLESLQEDETVILVGHSSGGACISYALENFSNKISKAIFLCGTMVSNGQKPFDVFAQELGCAEMFLQESKFLVYGNGKDNPPTQLIFEKQQLKGLYFNQSPSKDVALAMVSMRPIPLRPLMENLSISPENYGKGRRYYIQTLEDNALSPDVQEKMVRENPPEGVFKIKGSDHCPFFSKPQSLHKILLEIVQIP
ncbi:putative methylesterase 12, chloroplastic [Impatiens glandulifera]|uniref:putative methylesterase 12, chloroplastic n=1 Tax=Impatiens glandulifera TaxID=253017 RepID=UPI001FB0C371|nr:putative methylesterase 12, chloroplastic [Impatiens glandulifera]XP_047321885.1 putative methylesterase 12, chloroplastic [Impatiens glandulifera]